MTPYVHSVLNIAYYLLTMVLLVVFASWAWSIVRLADDECKAETDPDKRRRTVTRTVVHIAAKGACVLLVLICLYVAKNLTGT